MLFISFPALSYLGEGAPATPGRVRYGVNELILNL